jgi:DNA-binding CsgD family transcriptional regulator
MPDLLAEAERVLQLSGISINTLHMTNQEISLKLNLSEHTVRNYLLRIFDKLGISSRVELVLYAFSGVEGVTAPVGSNADPAER